MQNDGAAGTKEEFELALSRDRATVSRTEWWNDLQSLQTRLKHFADSKSQFMAAVQSIHMAGQLPNSTKHLESLFYVLQRDEALLSESIVRAQRLDPELGHLEHAFLENDKSAIPDQQPAFTGAIAQHDPQEIQREPPGQFDADSDGIPEAVSNYFEAVGDSRLMIANLEEELPAKLREEISERERKASQDIPLGVSDDEFNEIWTSRVQQARHELVRLQERAQYLHGLCIAQGLNTDPSFYRKKSESAESTSIDTGEAIQDWLEDLPNSSPASLPDDSISWSHSSLQRHDDNIAPETSPIQVSSQG
ncbi:hypothetical protein M409DRAFT_29823 [Zasmidium cellare ATCC 36951]|uniref:Uncharacterized protein n=1 Tax=Zasmidium cellare ATCC 36951 TaxID=1080233 RepID=A0A6A6C1R2_ZASCE|nr:uncharacterized protein M409DRAFT_29823 [Zasmidium cellare ATCC 36951]KAF2159656.1 hypothetical protein M409DRAFT_29823 [Zasmidium cellare ATCC 36951]